MPRGRTVRGEESKARLLRAAIGAFAQQGYHQTKVSDIVAAAGLTQRAFYLYFESKEAIFAELIREFRDRLGQVADAGKLVTDLPHEAVPMQVLANVEELFRFLAADPELTRIGFVLAPDAEEVKRAIAQLVVANLKRNQVVGHVRADVAPDVAAEAMVGMMERLIVRWLLSGEKEPTALARAATDLFLHGILPRP